MALFFTNVFILTLSYKAGLLLNIKAYRLHALLSLSDHIVSNVLQNSVFKSSDSKQILTTLVLHCD